MLSERPNFIWHLARLVSLAALLAIGAAGNVSAQTIAGYAIGENHLKLNELGNAAWQYDYGEYTSATFNVGPAISISSAVEKSTGRVVRLEASWSGRGKPEPAYFSDFKFGLTDLATIRQRLGSSGALPASGSPVLSSSDGGVEISSFYEVANSQIIASFITKVSRDALVDLQRRYGAETYAHVAKVATLRSVVISDAAYFKSLRGTTSVFDVGYRPIAWEPAAALTVDAKREISLARIKPSQLPVPRVYSGPNNLPDLTGQSASFRTHQAKIADGMASGPSFAGEFAVIQIDCGSSCSNAFVGNVRTGEVFKLPKGGKDNLNLTLKYELSSRLMTAQWSEAETGKCFVEFFSFDDGEWVELLRRDIGSSDRCLASLAQNLR
ncbi:Hypothetical protein NGAL_HAMBI1145_14890 [Neorhizobium galegae bv. officinalis]|uniref:Uncharacterized protein n=1 Tax=Neorhizobium galegae bv. officinalis TaxID=323656 RepID=A0A0T7FCM8_NEOGA|nr:hypothetical protein [Neorhizobium galegae]CDZ32721.1 Hypothetical protein NGAL_HAMBI1145_14890 [Neorhizobium galegae bv. officinalis]